MAVDDIQKVTPLRREMDVLIPLDDVTLEGFLSLPQQSTGMVICAHASDAGRFLPRNQAMMQAMNNEQLGTLLVDLLMPAEQADNAPSLREDITLLAKRLSALVAWVGNHANMERKPIGLFASSVGASAALMVAAQEPQAVAAVVCRSGKLEPVMTNLERVEAPVLLVVGGSDREALDSSEKAIARLNMFSRMEIILNATHLFEEPGAMEEMTKHSVAWFSRHLHERKKNYV